MTDGDRPGVSCPHCGYAADPDQGECPLCGSSLEESERGRAGRGGGGEQPDEYRGARWDRGGGRFPDDFVMAWKESVFSPSRFFSRLTPGSSLWRAALYLLVLSVVGAGLGLIWGAGLWGGGGNAAAMREALGASPDAVGRWAVAVSDPLIQFLITPFSAILLWAVGTLVFHVLVAILVEGHAGLRETARVVAYAWAGPQAFNVIPILGGMIATVWSAVLMVIGVREQHRTTGGRAAAVVLIPVLLLVVVPMVVGIVVAVSVLGGSGLLP